MGKTANINFIRDLVTECDRLIRAAELSKARALLRATSLTRVPRADALSIAKVCRRVGLIKLGIRILQPIVWGEKLKTGPATASELSEYAALLTRNGSIPEALRILKSVNASEAPERLLYESFCYICIWDHEKANASIRGYLATNPDPYMTLVSRANLAGGLVTLKQSRDALELINENILLAKSMSSMRIMANSLVQRAQLHFYDNEFQLSLNDLNQAKELVGLSDTYDRLLINKWEAIIESAETSNLGPLRDFKSLAERSRHWESVRDIDFFIIRQSFDSEIFDRLCVGTPFEAYRNRVIREINRSPHENYFFGGRNKQSLDLTTGEISGLDGKRISKKNLATLIALAEDIYVPRTVGSLFSALYPDERFDLHSSPIRIRQTLKRARQWIKSNHLPISIVEENGTYRLELGPGFTIQIPLVRPLIYSINSDSKLNLLRKKMAPNEEFSIETACELLGVSRSNFQRIARLAINSGDLYKTGNGKLTRYALEVPSTTSILPKAS